MLHSPYRSLRTGAVQLATCTEGEKKWQYTGEKASTQGCPMRPSLLEHREEGGGYWEGGGGGNPLDEVASGGQEQKGILGDAQGFIGKGQELAGNEPTTIAGS